MTIKLANNATSTLASSILVSDTTVTVASGTGARYPALSVGEYFYAALQDVNNNIEIVKVTARTGDAMTIERAQEGTTALAFAAGSLFDCRMTVQSFYDYIIANVGIPSKSTFTSVAGQASYGPLAFTPAGVTQVLVWYGGAVLEAGVDYTLAGTNVVLSTPPVVSGTKILTISANVLGGAAFDIAPVIHAAASKTTPADADEIPLVDSAASNALKKLTWANLKTTLGALYAALTSLNTWTKSQRGTVTAANTASYDMNLTNNFSTTLAAGQTIAFSNITAGQSGNILLVNGSNYTVAKSSYVKVSSSFLTTISATGTYYLSYYSPDGTNVYMTGSGALS